MEFRITKRILGCIKSPFDKKDYLMDSFLGPLVALPTEFDLTPKMTPVRSQGQEGACVGFAMAVGVKEHQEQLDYKMFIELSPRYLYEEAKKISGHTEGTTLKAAMQVAHTKGVCEERFWPYQANIVGQRASEADRNASKYRIKTYARIRNLDQLKASLVQFGPILIGIKIYPSMKKAKDTGIVPNPSCWERGNVLGGHALCAVGYNDRSPFYKNDGHIKFKNSWGDWGELGYGYISYKFARANILDAFSSVDILDPKPYKVADLTVERGREAWV